MILFGSQCLDPRMEWSTGFREKFGQLYSVLSVSCTHLHCHLFFKIKIPRNFVSDG